MTKMMTSEEETITRKAVVVEKKPEIELALKEFGLELKRIRESRGLTQARLHELSGIDKTVLSELERGLYTPSLNIIRQLAEGLAISPYILIAAYYGMPLPEFNLRDKETLENFIKLALDYLNAPAATSRKELEPENAQVKIGMDEAIKAHKRRGKAARKQPEAQNNEMDNGK